MTYFIVNSFNFHVLPEMISIITYNVETFRIFIWFSLISFLKINRLHKHKGRGIVGNVLRWIDLHRVSDWNQYVLLLWEW